MGSEEENLDDLLKSIMEGEEDSGHLAAEDDSLEDTGAAAADAPADFDFAIDELGESGEGLDLGKLGFDREEENTAEDFAIEDFAIEDFGVLEPEPEDLTQEEEENSVIPDSGSDFDAGITEDGELDFDAGMTEDGELDSDGGMSKSSETGGGAEDPSMEDFAMEDFAIEDFGVMEPSPEDLMDEEEPDEENAFTGEADFRDGESSDAIIDIFPEEEQESLASADDIDAMFATADAETESNGPALDSTEDMLALLERMSEEAEAGESAAADAAKADQEKEADVTKKNRKEKKKGLFSGRKKEKEAEKEKDSLSVEPDAEEADGAVAGEIPKKQTLFSKVIAFLTEADDEGGTDKKDGKQKAEPGLEPSDENKDILNELDEEDKKKKKKKIKGKKGQPENPQGDEDEEGEPVEDKKKAKKKKKKIAAAAEPELVENVKPGKKVSKKNIAIITSLCLTITAVIVVLCSVVPGFFDKRKARDAYYQSDYSKSYEFLYGKKLDNSDSIIFNKSRIILELNRKLESYHNYLGIGKEVQALDALMAGVEKYPDILLEAEEYHVSQEVSAIYETILNILNDKYDLSEPVAKVIIAYDDLNYTRKLESIVNNTPFEKAEEGEEAPAVTDVLPEEQAILEEEAPEAGTETSKEQGNSDQSGSGENAGTGTEDGIEAGTEGTTDGIEAGGGNTGNSQAELPADSQTDMPQEAATPQAPAQETPDTGSQGQLIQGISQPMGVEIHEN